MGSIHDLPAHEVVALGLKQQRERRARDQISAGAIAETCKYCGHKTWCPVRVIRSAPVTEEGAVAGENGHWKAEPCCQECHIGPQPKINGHFCYKADAAVFLRRAGSNNLGG
jgi:hypothetical protein